MSCDDGFKEYITCSLLFASYQRHGFLPILNIYNVTVFSLSLPKYQLCGTVGKGVYIYLLSNCDFNFLLLL